MRKGIFSTIYPMGYRLLMSSLLACTVVNGVGYLCGISRVSLWNWIVMIWTIFLVSWLNYGKTTWKLLAGIVMLHSIVVMIPLITAEQVGVFWENYSRWFIGAAGYEKEWVIGYELIQTVWVVLACYFLQIVIEKKQIFRDIIAVLFIAGLLSCMLLKVQIGHVGVAFATGYIFIAFVQRVRIHWEKQKKHDSREYVLFLLPFFMVYVIALICIPVRKEPYDWKLVKSVYENISEKVIIWRESLKRNKSEDFGLAAIGFSEQSRFADGLVKQDKVLMTIDGDSGLATSSYLRGKSYDTFSGMEWKKTINEDFEEYPLDTFELLYAIRRYDEEGLWKYVRATNLKVRYEKFNTGYLFVPGKVAGVRDTDCVWSAGDVVFGEQKGFGTEYSVLYYQLNLDTPELAQLLEVEQSADEGVWNKIMDTKHSLIKKSYSLDDLYHYQNNMKEHYCKEVVVSEKLQQQLDDVTTGCETKLQKLKAYEEWLMDFSYTTTPGELPRKVKSQETFLDYFLLEGKKGYCSHFATAFVLLARAEGLPARYVEGFCVSPISDEVIEVSSNMVHAWPEVYFEGVGWIPFEPTPGYATLRYRGWQVSTSNATSEDRQDLTTEAGGKDEEIEKQKEVYEKNHKRKQRITTGLQRATLIFLICVLIIFAVEKTIQGLRYKRMSTEKKFLVEVRRNLWIFARLGYRRKEFETWSELQERIRKNKMHWMDEKKEFVFLKIYQEYLYRNEEISERLLQETQEETKDLLLKIKKDNKRAYYVICMGLLLRVSM